MSENENRAHLLPSADSESSGPTSSDKVAAGASAATVVVANSGAANAKKKALNLVVIGHVDAGKSTTTGHLLLKCGGVDSRTAARLEKEAAAAGKGSFKYAWALDRLASERDRGITIDTSHSRFETDSVVFTIIDAPGHRDFVKNMISGAAQADAALLLVSAVTGEFEAGFDAEGGQTREHALLAYSLGVRQMIVCCNKMDDASVAFSEARFREVEAAVGSFARKLGFPAGAVPIVPTSGWEGDNIVDRSDRTPWYSGPTLLEALDALTPPLRDPSAALRVPLQDIYKIAGIGVVAVGRVEAGTLRPGDEVVFAPGGARATVGTVEFHNVPLAEAPPGMYVGFSLKHVQLNELRRGCVVGRWVPPSNSSKKGVSSAAAVAVAASSEDADGGEFAIPDEVTSFDAQIIVLSEGAELSVGYTPIVDCHTAHVPCAVDKLYCRIDRRTGKVMESGPLALHFNEAGIVRFVPTKPLCVEEYARCAPLGRFTIRDDKRTVAVGIVKTTQRRGAVGSAKK